MTRTLNYYTWPIAIVIFFLALAAGNVGLYRLANDSHQGSELFEPHAYESGLKYQQKLDALERFRRTGMHVSITTYSEISPKTLQVRITGSRSDLKRVTLRHGRAVYAASQEYDQDLSFSAGDGEPGTFSAPFDRRPGIYLLSLEMENELGEAMIFETTLN